MDKFECMIEKLGGMEEKLIDCMSSNMCDLSTLNTSEAGEVVDMIKDIAEAKAKLYEAAYYKSVTDAMEDADKESDDNRDIYGYNPRRYRSSGRYAPAGRGNVMGYNPIVMQRPYVEAWMHDPDQFRESVRMGYPNDFRNNDSGRRQSNYSSRYGAPYNEFQEERRYYTEHNDPESKRRMDQHAEEHINDTITTIKDIWKTADPELKKRMKHDLQALVSEMA